MSANLSIQNGQAEMFSGQSMVPWHGLGTIVEGLLTSQEAIKAAHLDWTVRKAPAYQVIGGEPIEIPGYSVVEREDNNFPLSIVQGRYELIQNEEAFDFFDSVVQNKEAMFDTAGALDEGRVIWLMAKVPGQLFVKSNPDDKIDKNVLLVTSHNGRYSLMMQVVSTRVVCSNTLSVALKGATNRIKIRHTKNFRDKINEAQKALELTHAYFEDLQGLINLLSETPMTQKEMDNFTARLFPAKDEDEIPTRTQNIRENVSRLFTQGKGNRGLSRWDGLNAVTEFVDYHRSTRNDTSRFEAGLLGSGVDIKQRAVQLLTP